MRATDYRYGDRSHPYHNGWESFILYKSTGHRNKCPHPIGSGQWAAWHEGWDDAREDPRFEYIDERFYE